MDSVHIDKKLFSDEFFYSMTQKKTNSIFSYEGNVQERKCKENAPFFILVHYTSPFV